MEARNGRQERQVETGLQEIRCLSLAFSSLFNFIGWALAGLSYACLSCMFIFRIYV